MTEIEKHIKECEHRVAVIVDSKFAKSDTGKENIRILASAIEACGKQIPKIVPDIECFGRCPECDTEFNSELLNGYNILYCPWCGQKFDWTGN